MITLNPPQGQTDVAVVLPTILRPELARAVRSVFRQNFPGRIHLLIGVDVHQGDTGLLDQLRTECPSHVSLTVLDPGYSTSARHGGLHGNHFGGSLRTILSFLASSPYIAYLDDNDWWGSNHLTLLRQAIDGKHWAWSGRWLVHPANGWPICRDEWDSVGPGRGINAQRFGGFVQPSGLMMDSRVTPHLMVLWSMAAFEDGSGEDRLIFDQLNKNHPGGATDQFTSYCTLHADTLRHDHHQREFLGRKLGWIYDSAQIAHITAQTAQAEILMAASQWEQAQDVLTDVLAIQPHHAPAMGLLARCHHQSRVFDLATNAYARALEVDDNHPQWLAGLAECLDATGRETDAVKVRASLERRWPG